MTVKTLAAAITLALLSALPAAAAELVMVESRLCSYCAKFNREVAPSYSATAAGRVAGLRKVSAFKKWPADLAGVTPAPFVPVFIVVDKGREIGRFAGYTNEATFWNRLKPLLRKAG